MSDLDGHARTGANGSIRRPRADDLQAGLNLAGLAGLGVFLCAGAVLPSGWLWGKILALVAFLLLWLVVRVRLRPYHPHDRFGPANTVTLIRGALVCALLAPLLSGAPGGWTVAVVAGAALCLDGVDGWLARRSALASDFGARFDIEIDALTALILSIHAYSGTAAGAEVLALGLVRYVFVAASVLWPWLAGPLPPRWRRKAICVVQLATLTLLQIPDLPADSAIIAARLALALLLWSFATDILWLRSHRR
ncbi:CDP-alcohol phosphatidyltransferase family protein [Paracoccus xiamenensis]|uniref:CDP-alcohol phosphatidyltransferase family protein n=1 Tax=Paracoccus xiamenensis TaxID=2714901 RepID=UPI001408AEA6|nr:CDP-alcohol phosphatidyltransferase family protein [Paracoccus xiamenensis]NHF72011.1 CDP-alcohol phosphatidyltransferase family protein [Paracoccus xiamenensis]